MTLDAGTFVYAVCQAGAESVLKAEVARDRPDWRPSYMRPGFLTFKLTSPMDESELFALEFCFARRIGVSLGKTPVVTSESPVEADAARAAAVWHLAAKIDPEGIHLFPRDGALRPPRKANSPVPQVDGEAESGVELEPLTGEPAPAAKPARVVTPHEILTGNEVDPIEARLEEIEIALAEAAPESFIARQASRPETAGDAGLRILDVCVVQADEWWVGWHISSATRADWPGGLYPEAYPLHAISRGFLKVSEGFAWAGFPLAEGQTLVELGCAPGGASQAMLEAGLNVIGIDPADIAPQVAHHSRFRHLRMRSKDVKRKEFQGVDWLYADINLPPTYTLDSVEGILEHPSVNFQGMVLILKLSDWSLAEEIPNHLERIESWGYAHVKVRHLSMNGREVCVAAW
jgi:23S rRNA (cytidine2498-2'-O)-methyltransferase